MSHLRLASLMGGVFLLTIACSTDDINHPSSSLNSAPPSADKLGPNEGNDLLTIVALSPALSVSGSLRPGEPIELSAVAAANVAVASGVLEVISLGDTNNASQLHRVETLTRSDVGQRWTSAHTIAYTSPGYYRIVVRSRAEQTKETAEDGAVILTEGFVERYLLVDRVGGRVDEIYDTTIAAKNGGLAYGSFGAFGVSETIRTSSADSRASISSVISSYSGTATYLDWQMSPAVRRPIRDGYVETRCHTGAGDLSTSTRTDNLGGFSVVFNSVCNSADARVQLIDSYSSVLSGGGLPIGGWMTLVLNSTIDYQIANDWAYAVYDDIRTFAPLAFVKFGQSRSRVSVWVSSSDPGYGVFYSSDDDRIKTNFSAVLLSNGTFTTMHEYGHAFHYKALEMPRQGSGCTNHHLGDAISLSCAFTEGFADFFSWWVAGDSITGGGFDDAQAESNPYRTNGNGAIIEGAVAAVYYDMVDGLIDRNDPGNSNGVEDDNYTWPGSYIAALIRTCSVKRVTPGTIPPVYVWETLIAGIDEIVPCAEHDVNARLAVPAAYQNTWRSYVDYSEAAVEPVGWSQNIVRAIWLYNLYNLGSLP